MGERTQEITEGNKNVARSEINAFVEKFKAGDATSEDIQGIISKINSNTGVFQSLGPVEGVNHLKGLISSIDFSPEKLVNDPILAEAERSFRGVGALAPTAFSEVQDLARALQFSSEDLINLQKAFTQGEFDVAAENVGRFADLNAQTGLDILNKFGGQFADVEKSLRPEDAALREELQRQITSELQLGGQLSGDQNRLLEQSIQGAQTSRGTAFGNSAVSAEALSKGTFSEALKKDRQNAASQLLQLNAQTQLDPISAVLGRQVVRSAPNTQFAQSFQPFAQQAQGALGTVPFNQQSLATQQQQQSINEARGIRTAQSSLASLFS